MENIVVIILGVLAFPVFMLFVDFVNRKISKICEKYFKKEHESTVRNKLEEIFIFIVIVIIVIGIFLSNL